MRTEASDAILREPATSWGEGEFQLAIQITLAALADVDTYFASELKALAEWGGPEHTKVRITRELEEDHERGRAPYVRHLASLESYMRSVFKQTH